MLHHGRTVYASEALVITQSFATGGQIRRGGGYRYGSSSMFNTGIQGQKMEGVRRNAFDF